MSKPVVPARAARRRPPWVVPVVLGLLIGAGAAAGPVLASPAGASALSQVRIKAGDPVRDAYGHAWQADRRWASGGRTEKLSKAVRGTRTPKLFRTVRQGRFSYRMSVRPGVYAVRVNTATSVRDRIGLTPFAVRVNGAVHIPKLDARRHVASFRPYSAQFTVTIRSQNLTLAFDGPRGAAVSSFSVLGVRPLPKPPARPAPSRPVTTAPSSAPSSAPTPAPVSSPTTSPSSAAPSSTPTTAPATPTAAPSSAPTGTVSPEAYGAAGDGRTDDATALQRTFDNAAGRTVVLPAGRTYAFGRVLHLQVRGLHVTGGGTLLALDQEHSDVWLDADDILIDGTLTIRTKSTTQRWGTWDQMGVRIGPRTGVTLRGLTVSGSAAAGIYLWGSDHFLLDHVTVQDTRADGIHMTGGASYGRVVGATVRNSGDDGVAIVSYKQDGTPCHDITVSSPRVLGTTWGRGLSVVGGRNITETDIYVADSSAAGIYLAAEGNPWFTAAPTNVTIDGGTILRANRTTSVEHGAVFVLSGENDVAPDTVTVRNLTIRDTVVAKRNLGVITYGRTPSSVLFENIAIIGGTAAVYEGNTAQSAYRLRSITKDGVRQPDRG